MNSERDLLGKIFELQDTAVAKHMKEFPVLFGDLSSVVNVIGSPGLAEGAWAKVPEIPRTIFNYFYSDSFSSLASGIRLAYHGLDTDCYALLRVVMENLTILEFIIENNLYSDAFDELQERVGKGRPFSEKFSYTTALKDLQIDIDRRRFWGELSALGSHASPLRLRWSRMEFAGIPFFKLGVVIENPKIQGVIETCLKVAVLFGEVMGTFYTAFTIEGERAYQAELTSLTDRLFKSP